MARKHESNCIHRRQICSPSVPPIIMRVNVTHDCSWLSWIHQVLVFTPLQIWGSAANMHAGAGCDSSRECSSQFMISLMLGLYQPSSLFPSLPSTSRQCGQLSQQSMLYQYMSPVHKRCKPRSSIWWSLLLQSGTRINDDHSFANGTKLSTQHLPLMVCRNWKRGGIQVQLNYSAAYAIHTIQSRQLPVGRSGDEERTGEKQRASWYDRQLGSKEKTQSPWHDST